MKFLQDQESWREAAGWGGVLGVGRGCQAQGHCQDPKGPSSRLNVLISKSTHGPREAQSFLEGMHRNAGGKGLE